MAYNYLLENWIEFVEALWEIVRSMIDVIVVVVESSRGRGETWSYLYTMMFDA